MMGDWYRNSYVTVAAADSTDSSSGCLPTRSKVSYTSAESKSLGYRAATGAFESGCSLVLGATGVHLTKEWLPGSLSAQCQISEIGAFGKRFDPLSNEPLGSRGKLSLFRPRDYYHLIVPEPTAHTLLLGWTLQERLLPSRTIHYAKDQLYFECETKIQAEDGSSFQNLYFSLPRLLSTQYERELPKGYNLTNSDDVEHFKNSWWRGGWLSLVEDYSQRNLTRPEDKLPALSGLARVIAQATGDQYYAGLWARESQFEQGLFWRTYTQEETFSELEPVKGRVLGQASKPAAYRAPSWSWASIDTPLRFIPLTYTQPLASIVKCELTPAGADSYGRLAKGRLVIEVGATDLFL